VNFDKKNMNKNISISVCDKNLISKTGGVVQGMSGSPIIQNNMLVGAITHVVSDNPLKGYGIFAETMVNNQIFRQL
jgi:stage IV sporulation protein B